MSVLRTTVQRLYRVMLGCYPGRLRRDFGDEMQWVFDEHSAECAERGVWALLAYFLMEWMDWPLAVVQAYREETILGGLRRLKAAPATTKTTPFEGEHAMLTEDEFAAQEPKQIFWISFPPLLLGLGVMVAALVRTDVWYRLPTWQLYSSVGITLLPGAIVAGVGLAALLKRIPDWGITWLGSGFMGLVLTLQVFLGELVDEGTIMLDPALETGLGLGFFLAGLALLLVTAARGWSRSGLFSMAAAATMGLSLVQSVTAAPINRDDLALLAGPLGLVFALLIYLYCWKPGAVRWSALALTALLNVGVVFIMANAWSEWRISPAATSFVPALLVLITGLLISGPISGLLMRPILRRLT